MGANPLGEKTNESNHNPHDSDGFKGSFKKVKKILTSTLTITKNKYTEFICGVSEKDIAAMTAKYTKQGYTVLTTEEKPYPKR